MRILICLPLMLALTACVKNPVTGRQQLMLVSEREAINASAQAWQAEISQLREQGKLSTDAALRQRVERITGRLIAQAIRFRPETADWQWRVQVIEDDKVLNAYCMAGGRMAIYTGIIRQLKLSDDEIAQIMGHEIAHALSNHTAERMSVAMASQLGISAVALYKKRSQLQLTGAAMAAAVAIQLPNSRAAESESDRIGIELAAKARYAPQAAVSLWEKMAAANGKSDFDWLSTHPSPGKRIDALRALIPEMEEYFRAQSSPPQFPLERD